MSSRPDDLGRLLDEVEAALEWEGKRCVAEDMLSRMTVWEGCNVEDDPRYRLARGLARYLIDKDDAAREDYRAALELATDDITLRIRALCRLSLVDTFHKKHDQAALWLQQAEEIVATHKLANSVLAEVAFRRGCLEEALRHSEAATVAFTCAGNLFLDAGLKSRWLSARVAAVEQQMLQGAAEDIVGALRTIEYEATTLGVERVVLVPALVDLANSAYLSGHRHNVGEWLNAVEDRYVADVPAYEATWAGVILHRSGHLGKSRRFLESAADRVDDEDSWFAALHLLAIFPADDTGGENDGAALLAHVREGVERGVPATALLAASKLLVDNGALDVAEEACRAILAAEADPFLIAAASVNLVGVLVSRGDIQEALEVRKSIDLGHLVDDPEMLAIARLNDAYIFVVRGHWEEANLQILPIVDELKRVGDNVQLATALMNGVEWAWLCDQDEAAWSYLEELDELVPDLSGRVHCLSLLTIASVLREHSADGLANEYLDRAAAAAMELEDPRPAILAELNRAWIVLNYRIPLSVPSPIRRSARIGLDIQLKALEARCRAIPDLLGFVQRSRGIAALKDGQPRKAERHFRRAAKSFARAGRIYDHADSLDWVARVTDDEARAISHAERATRLGIGLVAVSSTERSRVQALARMRPMGSWLVGLHARKGDGIALANAIYEVKAGEFLRDSLGVRESLSPAALRALARAVETGSAKTGPPSPSAALRRAPSSIGIPRSLSSLSASALYQDAGVADARVSARRVLRWLRSDEAAIEYFVDQSLSRLWIVILHRGKARVLSRKLRSAHLEAINSVADVAAGRLFGGDPRWLLANLKLLHRLLIVPLGSIPTRSKRIWFAPGGLLNTIPFAALLNADAEPLIAQIDVRLLVTTAQLALLPRISAKQATAIVLRGADAGEDALPSADLECESVRVSLREAGVSVARAVTLDALANADVIHYAGHGYYDADQARNHLALPGFDLDASDFAKLRLRRRPLVVLSACESGVGATGADGLTGFVRGAFAAGARSVVCSGWAADDRSTAHLMASFYALLGREREPAQALRQSIRDLMNARPDWRHPFYWANFRCYGVG